MPWDGIKDATLLTVVGNNTCTEITNTNISNTLINYKGVHGGTNTAYQLALQNNAIIFNLYHADQLDKFIKQFGI